MSKDLKQKKSDYLLELALEEQLEQDEDMKKYPLPEDVEHPHVFSEEHEKRMQEIFKMADKVEHQSYRRKKHFQLAAGIALFFMFDYGDRDTGGGLPTSGISVLFRGNGKVNVLWSGRSADRT